MNSNMKKNLLYMVMALALAMPFTACDDDENTGNDTELLHDPYSDEDQTEITAYNALEWLQNSIVVIDENGNIVRRVYGEMLEPSDTTILSIAAADLDAAETIFLNWVAPMKENDLERVENGYIYNLTDANGNPQGSVEFKSGDGSNGILARMTVGAGTDLKYVSEIHFIDKDAWPENAGQTPLYEKGGIYTLYAPSIKCEKTLRNYSQETRGKWGPGHTVKTQYEMRVTYKYLDFYCIQGNGNGQEAILVYLSPDVDKSETHGYVVEYIRSNAQIHLATVPEAQKVLDHYTANYEDWVQMIACMEERGHEWDWHYGIFTTGNAEFLLNGYDRNAKKMKCLDLDNKDGKICDVSENSCFRYRFLLVRTMPAYVGE